MSTNYDSMQAKDFAEHCVNALGDVKRAIPRDWEQVLKPYQEAIKLEAASSRKSYTYAVLAMMKHANESGFQLAAIRMRHVFLMAAYCTMI